jgi:hypothetical protein
VPILKFIVLSRWTLVVCLVVSVAAVVKERPRTMEMRQGEVHHIIGVPIDAHTRIVAGEAARRLRAFGKSRAQVQAPAQATFTISPNTIDPLPAPALAALQYAANIWAELINSPVPIEIYARWTSSSPALASGTTSIWRDSPNAPIPNVWYPKPLADAFAGYDISPGGGGPNLIFNSTANWYFGTDGRTPAGQYDFVTVALHEITHSLGFIPMMWVDNNGGGWSVMHQNDPAIYSRFVVNGGGQSLLNTSLFPNPSAALGSQLTSNNLFWSGAAGIAALGGTRPKLFAPSTWVFQDFGSVAHLDEVTYPAGNANSLMTPVLNTAEAIHVPGPAVLGMLNDMGWAPDATCSYSITQVDLLLSNAAFTGIATNVLAPANCAWTVTNNNPEFITVTSSAAGNGPGTVRVAIGPNGGPYRAGTLTIAGQTLTVRQYGTGLMIGPDKLDLRFGAASLGGQFAAQTPAQVVRLRQSIGGTVTWTAQSTQAWLQVTPTAGAGSADLSVSVIPAAGVPISGQVTGAIHLTYTGASNPPDTIAVTLTTTQNGLTSPPIGTVDTPADMQTGVTGAIAMTGWALDDIDVDRISICRLPYWFESPSPNPECAGRADVFVGYAVRVEGARPDVETAFSNYPINHKGGWGFMILTNMLPLGGPSGYSYTFIVSAFDREGQATRLGVRTISCANDVATKPFGAIDTPEQGGTASGSAYINFGWALTPQPKTIPIDGSTITVLIDGNPVGHVSYNHYRPDIATLFPDRNNSNGAVGYRILDTTALANGVHTISWIVTDDHGISEGIGSRYFTVSNGAGAMTSAATAALVTAASDVRAVPSDRASIAGRRGVDLSAEWIAYDIGADGRAVVHGEELDRFELALASWPGQRITGYLRVGDRLEPLPAGSQLDPSTGAFTWAPGVGFIGPYDFVFMRSQRGRMISRHDVRIVLHPKHSGMTGVQLAIDTPQPQQDVVQPFAVAGWTADLAAPDGTGIGTVHVWAYPLAGGPPVFLGAASYGTSRPDVAALHGERFGDSAFGLIVQGLPPGAYDLAVFAWSTEKGDFAPARTVRVTVR